MADCFPKIDIKRAQSLALMIKKYGLSGFFQNQHFVNAATIMEQLIDFYECYTEEDDFGNRRCKQGKKIG